MKIDINRKLLRQVQSKTHPNWTLWETKNLNIHRGLIDFTASGTKSIHDLASQVRNCVRDEFRPNWFRGFGFGTIIRLPEVPTDFSEICEHIDTRNKKGGVWQWAIVCLEEDKIAIAIHTWLHGYLRPVYDSVLEQLTQNGYQCHASDAEVDVLVARLQRIAHVCRMIRRVAGIAT